MKALLYNPYLDTLGGGERYIFGVADCLLKSGWRVELVWLDAGIVAEAKRRFGFKLMGLRVAPYPLVFLPLLERWRLLRRYDLVFWVSDGSVPLLFAKKNILHFQVPFAKLREKRWLLALKKRNLTVVCNSYFTKEIVDKTFGFNSKVLYPPVDVKRLKAASGKKENMILAVGRFEETMQSKRQDVLIQAFVRMVKEGLSGWRLVLIGASKQPPSKNHYLRHLYRMAAGYPIEFKVNVSFEILRKFYQRAKIFWHAAGFGIDERKEPERVEHFGISVVEAMAAGCVPVVVNKGGLREIVRRGVGERWDTPKELIEKTWRLIVNPSLWSRCQKKAQKAADKFSQEKFCQNFTKILGK